MQLNSKVQADFDRIARFSRDDDWNHNRHYDGFLLRQLPCACKVALEIGCGTGSFARLLAERADQVLAVDLSPAMIEVAKARSGEHPNIDYQVADVATIELPAERFDAIVSIAALHHLPLGQILGKMASALKAGGTLLILDLYRAAGASDRFSDLVAIPISLLLRLLKTGRLREPRAVREAWAEHGRSDVYPTLAQVRAICARELPGAEVRRYLLWRYSIVWRKIPQGIVAVGTEVSPHLRLARTLADLFRPFPSVEGVALAGSQATGTGDQDSDIDVYVYITSVIPLSRRLALVERMGAARADLNLHFWDLGDGWHDGETGVEVDVIYWDTVWVETQLDHVLMEHQASTGYSTSHWHTIRNSLILYDRNGWLHRLKEKSAAPYPEALRRSIVAKNHPVLRRVIPSYLHQIEKAVLRNDLVSVNHRVAALLASYFDVLFALNRLPNPGEKRLLETASQRCARVPAKMVGDVESVLLAVSSADRRLIASVDKLIDGLDQLLLEEGFDPETSLPLVRRTGAITLKPNRSSGT